LDLCGCGCGNFWAFSERYHERLCSVLGGTYLTSCTAIRNCLVLYHITATGIIYYKFFFP
jgi:hypothetical protein